MARTIAAWRKWRWTRKGVEPRRRNFIPADGFPYQTPVALQYDSGDYQTTFKVALKNADWDGFETRKAAAAAQSKLRGIEISTYVEAFGIHAARPRLAAE